MIGAEVGTDLIVEIRPRDLAESPQTNTVGSRPHFRADQQSFDRSRLLRLTPSVDLDNRLLCLLSDPRIEAIVPIRDDQADLYVDVFCLPGVTDEEGLVASQALQLAGISVECRAGARYRFRALVPLEFRPSIEREIGNPLIQSFHWSDQPALCTSAPVFQPTGTDRWDIGQFNDDELVALSQDQGLVLDLQEMRQLRDHYRQLERAATDVEIQSFALAWSEHCDHKTFKALINLDHNGTERRIDGLLNTCLRAPTLDLNHPWVRSAFVDNAGIIEFDASHDLSVKVETHNHPTALEPYGGAHTGVGGVIRDILAVSAEPIANIDVLCFGYPNTPDDHIPSGVNPPRKTCREVVRGVADYGNNMGIPTVAGAILFDDAYAANPLVFCGTIGIAPRDSHPTTPGPGDAIVLIGGSTGRDGLGGATMSSASLDRGLVSSSTVQIGAPITEKKLRDALPVLRDEKLYTAITDCGAGGLCSAVGEMTAELGADVYLSAVPLKYEGLRPWEVWLSEAQERLVLAVPHTNLARLGEVCRDHEVNATEIGQIRHDGCLRLFNGQELVGEIRTTFLHGGRPRRTLSARYTDRPSRESTAQGSLGGVDVRQALINLLAHPNIASREDVVRRYDHEVRGGSITKPVSGRSGPSDGAMLRPLPDSPGGVSLGLGLGVVVKERDPYQMAMLAVDEALRNLIACGGSIDRAALLDNFCWGDVDDPDVLGALVRATEGCRDAALHYGTPFVSGKDSLRNTTVIGDEQVSIPGTLLITAVAPRDDASVAVTMDLKDLDEPWALYVVGDTLAGLAGTQFAVVTGQDDGRHPGTRPETPSLMRALSAAVAGRLLASCHDISDGGLAVAAVEMAIAGGVGLDIALEDVRDPALSPAQKLFSETPGRFLVQVADSRATEFEATMSGLPIYAIGKAHADRCIHFGWGADGDIHIDFAEAERAWRTPLLAELRSSLDEPAERTGATRHVSRQRIPLPHRTKSIRAVIIKAPGTNCDDETAHALSLAGAEPDLVHLSQLTSGRRTLDEFEMIILPGGFSYGDHLGAGAMLSAVLMHRLGEDLNRFVESGRPVVGICNGFQVLARSGLLPDVSLAGNVAGLFECRWVGVEAAPSVCPFFRDLDSFELPIAHGEGRVVVDSPGDLFATGRVPLVYSQNPNGSFASIAAVSNGLGNVLGMMPHPERIVDPLQHPNRSSREPMGLVFFENLVSYAGGL